jgi:hypothetical protein
VADTFRYSQICWKQKLSSDDVLPAASDYLYHNWNFLSRKEQAYSLPLHTPLGNMRISQNPKILIGQIIIERNPIFECILLQRKIERRKIRACIFQIIVWSTLISQFLNVTSRFHSPTIFPDFTRLTSNQTSSVRNSQTNRHFLSKYLF